MLNQFQGILRQPPRPANYFCVPKCGLKIDCYLVNECATIELLTGNDIVDELSGIPHTHSYPSL